MAVFRSALWAALLFLCAGSPRAAFAQQPDEAPAPNGAGATERSASAGMFLPLTSGARTDAQRGYVFLLGGYDSARSRPLSEARAEVALLPFLALRGGVLYDGRPGTVRPSLGLRAQLVSQERTGLDAGVGVYYRPEGFTQAEGEVELMLALARHFGRLGLFANAVYGQDPEASERDGEVRLAALYAVGPALQAGLDARVRGDLGSEPGKRRAEGGTKWDVLAGPTASYRFGSIAALAQLGMSLVSAQRTQLGAGLMVGLGGAL